MNEDDIIEMNFEIIRDVEKRIWSILSIYMVVMSLLFIGYNAIDDITIEFLFCVSGIIISLIIGRIEYLLRWRYLDLISDFEKTYKDCDKLFLKKHLIYEKKVARLLFITFMFSIFIWVFIFAFTFHLYTNS